MSVFTSAVVNNSRFASDLIHLLMCNDTYQVYHDEKKSSSEKIEFNGEDWFVHEVFREETKFLKMCTFKAVIYINDNKKQMVLAFKGLDAEFEDIFNDEGSLSNNINGVLLNGVIPQLITCYGVVEKANEIAKEKDYNLSFTGFSNGAWLAEYAIYYTHRYLKCKKTKLKAVLFDSPGIIKSIQETESSIINNQDRYDIYDIADNITSYLSSPNFSNSCNKHIGNTYRIFIDYDENKKGPKEKEFEDKLDKYIDKIFKKIKKVLEKIKKSINNIDMIKKSKFFISGLYSMFNHKMIKQFIKEFDSSTGKPKYFERVKNWPMIKLSLNDKYNENLKNLIGKGTSQLVDLIPLPEFIKKPGAFLLEAAMTNVSNFLVEKVMPGMHLIINIILELVDDNISFEQFDSDLFDFKIKDRSVNSNKSTSENDKESKKIKSENISLKLKCSYETEIADLKREKLFMKNPNIDWCLYELTKLKLTNKHQSTMDVESLRKIKESYKVEKDIHNDVIYLVISDENNEDLNTIEKLKDSLTQFREVYPNVIEILDQKTAEEDELRNQIEILQSNYIERKSIYKMIHKILSNNKYPVIQGLGGVGKSILVTQYAHKINESLKNQYIIRFIDSSTNDKIIAEYKQMANLLNIEINDKESDNLKYLIENIYNKLSKYEKTVLLIFDNLKDFKSFGDYLKGLGENMKIIITTRNKEIEEICNKFELIELDNFKFHKNEAQGYIQEKLKKKYKDENSIGKIIESIFDKEESISGEKLNLTIAYAIKYYGTQTLIKIIEIIKTKSVIDIAKTILRDVDKNSKEYLLLETVKYLDHNFIGNEFIKSLIETDDDDVLIEVVNNLENEGLINKIELNENYGIKLHDNLKEIIDKMESKKDIDYIIGKMNKITNNENYEIIEQNKVDEFKQYYNHIKIAKTMIESKSLNFDKKNYIQLLEKLGKYEEKVLINFKNNLIIQKIILDIKLTYLAENDLEIATSYGNIGNAYRTLGEAKNEIDFHEKSLAIRKTCLPENHPHIAASFNNLGNAYKALGENKKAIELYEKSLAIYKICLPENHPDIAASYGSLGNAYRALGETKKAIEFYEKTLEIYKICLPENHPSIATSYNNLGLAYRTIGESKKAIEFYEKSLEIQKICLPENHPDIATSYNHLGSANWVLGHIKKAVEYHEKSLAIRKICLPENHPNIATSYGCLGMAYSALGETKKAIELYDKSLEIYKICLPENHMHIATSYNNLGFAYSALGETKKAIEFHEKSLEMIKKCLPENHPHIATSYCNLGNAYKAIGETKKADLCFQNSKIISQYNNQNID